MSFPAPRLAAAVVVLSFAFAGCSTAVAAPESTPATSPSGGGSSLADSSITVYNAQHEELTQAWADAFHAETGVRVTLRNGDDSELGNQLVQEGAASPADVFLTENSPAMSLVEKAGLLADVDGATLQQVPAAYRPSTGKWTGIAARSTAFVYNPSKLSESELPKSLLDLADPSWKGRWAASPGGADFQAIVSALLALKGRAAAEEWLAGMQANVTQYQGNSTVMKAVNAGRDPGRGDLPLLLVHRPGRHQGEQREHQAPLLRQPGPRRLRERLGRWCPGVEQEPGRRSGVPRLHHRQGRPGRAPHGDELRVHRRERCSGEPGATRPGHPRRAHRGPRDLERRRSGRPDDEGGPDLTLSAPARLIVASRQRPPRVLVFVVASVVVLMLVPVFFVVSVTAQTGWEVLAPLLLRPKVGELLLNTVLLVVFGVPLCVAIGVGSAWLVERSDLPGRRVWSVLLAAPLAVPAFVSSYAWVSVVPSIGGLGGGLLISTLAYAPLVYLPALAALRGLDPALEDAARSLGLGPVAVFGRVLLPQLRLAIWGGGLVVALHLLAEYGAFAMIRFSTFTTAIMVQFRSAFAGPAANALGIVLTVLCLIVLVGEGATRGSLRYSRIGSGAAGQPTRTRLGPATAPTIAVLVSYLAAAVGVPLAAISGWLAVGDPWAQREIPQAVLTTLSLGVMGAAVIIILAMPAAWLAVRHPGRGSRLLEGAGYLASSLPGIIIALALVTVTIRLAPPLYQTVGTVVVAYAIMFMPRALVALRAGLAQAPPLLEEAARALGVSPLASRLRVTLPMIAPAAAAGAALVALGIANELTATLLLAPNGTRTLATEFWSASSSVAYSDAAPYALLLVVSSVPAVAVLLAQTRPTSKRGER